MFKVKCPHCKSKLSLNQRKGLLRAVAIYCTYCAKPIKIKEGSQYLNSIAIGVLIGGLLAILTSLSMTYVMVIAGLFGAFFQRYLDILFSLKVAKDEELL